MKQERRKFQRAPIFLIANVKDLKSFQQNSSGITADFSQEGIGIESHSICFHRGEILEILLKDPQSELSFSAEGEVVWKRDGWYNCKIGLKFRQITPLTINKILTLISGVDKIPAESHVPGNGKKESEGSDKEKKADPAVPEASDRPTKKPVKIDESIYFAAIETDSTVKADTVIDSQALNGPANNNPSGENTKSYLNKDHIPESDSVILKEPFINGSQNSKHLSLFLLILLSAVFLAAAILTSGNIKSLLGFNIKTDQSVFSRDAAKERAVSLVNSGQTNDVVTNVSTHDNDQNKSLSVNSDIKPVNIPRTAIMFDYNSDIIDPAFYPQIENITRTLYAYPKSIVKIKGHADNIGPEMYNLNLSMRRSLAVKKLLLRKGIGSERIKLAFFGESSPVASNLTVSGRMKNRRVEMLVVSAAD